MQSCLIRLSILPFHVKLLRVLLRADQERIDQFENWSMNAPPGRSITHSNPLQCKMRSTRMGTPHFGTR